MSALEYIDCPICERDETQLLFNKDSLSVVICKRCRLRYVNPRISRTTLEEDYIETYYPPDKVERIHKDSMEWLQMAERLTELEKQHPSKGRLLDVGCGIGTFLHLAREQGWNPHGIDPSKSGTTFAREIHELDVQCGDLFEASFPSAHFDAITLYHVLEHIPELDPFLGEIRRILKPSRNEKEGGTLAIEVPNGGSLQSRLQKADWPYVHPRDHLYYFSSQSLPKLLQKHGFLNVRLGKPKRVSPASGVHFTMRRIATAALVQFHLSTVIRVYAR